MTPPGNGTQEWREETIRVDGTELVVIKGGSRQAAAGTARGAGLAWMAQMECGAGADRTLLIPQHPGYNGTERAEWITQHPRHGGLLCALSASSRSSSRSTSSAFRSADGSRRRWRRAIPLSSARWCWWRRWESGRRKGDILDFFQMMAPQHLCRTVHDPDATPEFDAIVRRSGTRAVREVGGGAGADRALGVEAVHAQSQLAASPAGAAEAADAADVGPRG